MQIRRLDSGNSGFEQDFLALLSSSDEPETSVTDTVKSILVDIRKRGDEALVEYTNRFDQRQAKHADLKIPQQALKDALDSITPELKQGLEQAAVRIRSYHERQRLESWSYKDNDGTLLGQHVTPLDSVGVYVPGGKAAYPSSVLMNVIPAKVAGVKEIIMVVPAPKGEIIPLVLAAASIAGVTQAFSIGGAQAVAALAYGTETVPRVDKIVGPGNIYVATAKRMVFGTVGIDMIAGPSEVLIISDGNSNPDWIAMDLFAQAEHDEEACAILICPDNEFLNSVEASIKRLLPEMERSEIIQQALRKNGALIHVEDIHDAVEIANRVAPEHLELSVSDPEALLTEIRHAGAIFMGCNTAEALGDYCAGPNHVLPTARTARFSSPLGVYDFQKRSSMIMCTDESVSSLAGTASILARGEGLTAHARSAEFRIKKS
jgi:histidinol dehydrogenase